MPRGGLLFPIFPNSDYSFCSLKISSGKPENFLLEIFYFGKVWWQFN